MKGINLKIVVIILFLLGFIVRLYRIDFPLADWHSWRQTDTSAVSKIFVEKGFDILHPRYFDISNIQTGKDNPNAYRFVEFPLYNIFQALLFKIFPLFSLEVWGRILTIIVSLLTAYFLQSLVAKYSNKIIGILAAAFYLFFPFSIYYSRTILPDTSMVMASIGGLYFLDRWLEKKNLSILSMNFLASILLTASSFLLKPYALFFTLPYIILVYNKFKFTFLYKWQLLIFAFFSILPFVVWRIWISQFPEGIPSYIWLLNGNGIRFRPSFFKWIFYERITKLILGYSGIIIFANGILSLLKLKNNYFFASFLFSSLLYLFVIATGNVQHDYYQILIIPTISLFSALGIYYLYYYLKKINTSIALLVVIIIAVSGFYFSWNMVKSYFNINNEALVVAGRKADKLLPKDAKVIAPYDGDTTLLYYVNRQGWPAFQSSIEDLIKMGATHMILISPTANDLNGFGKTYTIIAQSKDYLILQLK